MTYRFPFGERVRAVRQADRSPKQAFVLGVYASAVHARWLDPAGRQRVRALAVASEPEIFWRGEGAQEIIARIPVPPDAGSLVLPEQDLNGPSGRALDELYLLPLGLRRDDVWLADLLPESRVGKDQAKAIARAYQPLVAAGVLPATDVPVRPQRGFVGDERRAEIAAELEASAASLLVTLGQEPIREFVRFYGPAPALRKDRPYGVRRVVSIAGRRLEWLPLVHPRQGARMRGSSKDWGDLHELWVAGKAVPR